jgi:hypothetical protein
MIYLYHPLAIAWPECMVSLLLAHTSCYCYLANIETEITNPCPYNPELSKAPPLAVILEENISVQSHHIKNKDTRKTKILQGFFFLNISSLNFRNNLTRIASLQ